MTLKPGGLPLLWCPWCGTKSFRAAGRKNDPDRGWTLAGRCESCRAYISTAPGDVKIPVTLPAEAVTA